MGQPIISGRTTAISRGLKYDDRVIEMASEMNPQSPAAEPQDRNEHYQHAGNDAASGIYLVSPSGPIHDVERLSRATERLQAMGFEVDADTAALLRYQRFAGNDIQRLDAMHRSLDQHHPIVMATRGGYGLSRLLPLIDWAAVAESGKHFVGHSDFTAFSLALLARTGAVSYSGPSAVADFGDDELDDLTADLFAEVMRNELELLSFESPDADPVDARGVLWGGNLAMVASLVGTPYMPVIDGGILFLEDVAEHPYRIERMLTQLWHAGILERQHAIVLGHFTEYRLGTADNGYGMDTVIQWLRDTVKVPVITGLPYGHVKTKATLPVGKTVGVATEDGMAYLLLNEHF